MVGEKQHPVSKGDPEVAPPALCGEGNRNINENENERYMAAKDEAIAMVGEQEHTVDPVIVARAVRKIDLFLIPTMVFGCE